MATTSSIGTAARDYSTIQAWEDASTTGGWIGECYNDSEFLVSGTVVTFAGLATSATDFITLRCATGQSFRDNADIQTNAFTYNQSNGVGLRCSAGYASAVVISEDYVTISDIQIKQSGTQGNVISNNTIATANCVVENCILMASNTAAALLWRNGTIRNSLLIQYAASSGNGIGLTYPTSALILNSVIVRPSDVTAGGTGIVGGATTTTVKNCAIFGFPTFSSGTYVGSNNCSDQTIGFGTSNQESKTYANQFVNTTNASQDFKLKTGSDCLDNAATDTSATPDIAKTTRPQGSAYDIGCWELVSGGGSVALAVSAGLVFSNSVAMQGAATLTASSLLSITPTASLVGTSMLAGSTAAAFLQAVNLTGTSSLAGALPLVFSSTVGLVGTASLTGATNLPFVASGVIAGAATLAASSESTVGGSASLQGAAAVAGAANLAFTSAPTLAGAASLAGVTVYTLDPTANLTAVGGNDLVGGITLSFTPSGGVSGSSTLSANASVNFGSAALVIGSSAMVGTSDLAFVPTAGLSVTGDAGTASLAGPTAMAFMPVGSITGDAAIGSIVSITFACSGTINTSYPAPPRTISTRKLDRTIGTFTAQRRITTSSKRRII